MLHSLVVSPFVFPSFKGQWLPIRCGDELKEFTIRASTGCLLSVAKHPLPVPQWLPVECVDALEAFTIKAPTGRDAVAAC